MLILLSFFISASLAQTDLQKDTLYYTNDEGEFCISNGIFVIALMSFIFFTTCNTIVACSMMRERSVLGNELYFKSRGDSCCKDGNQEDEEEKEYEIKQETEVKARKTIPAFDGVQQV